MERGEGRGSRVRGRVRGHGKQAGGSIPVDDPQRAAEAKEVEELLRGQD